VKSVTRGNAGQDASLPDSGAMPVMAGDDAFGDGGSSRPGGQDPGRVPLRELMDDRLLDRSKDAAGGLRLTGEGSRPLSWGGPAVAVQVRAVRAGKHAAVRERLEWIGLPVLRQRAHQAGVEAGRGRGRNSHAGGRGGAPGPLSGCRLTVAVQVRRRGNATV
jgi:hypothetical protein